MVDPVVGSHTTLHTLGQNTHTRCDNDDNKSLVWFFSRQNAVLVCRLARDVRMTPGVFWPVDMNPKKVFC